MEGLAEPGTTCVTEDTFKLTEGFFRFESLGEKRVKGKEAPVKVYQAITPSTRRTRFDVSAERGLTPFVGRERELELLLDGFERVKAGKGQAFSIVSEAGCGKSRLLYEFRKAIANEDVNFLEGKCLSYGKAIAYHPHIDILKSSFDIQEGEGDQQIREKVTNGLKALGADEVTTLPYLLEILSVKDSGIDQVFMSPEEKRDRIGEAIKRIVIKGSESQPLVIAIEDLHWMDKGSEDVVKTVLGSLAGSRVLLILTYRPEFVPNWGAKSYQNQLTLHRLSNRESLEMVRNVLVTKEIERALGNLVFEKTEGVPFFIEEFVTSFKDLKIIEEKGSAYQLSKDVQRVMIPSTIQDVIMARVDSLPERAKEVLQTGSVIEREFTYELIKCIMGSPEQELLFNLSVLKDSELLYERGICPQSSYIFKHALIREVIYDSILANRKKRLHEEIANVIEELYRNNLSGHFEVLSEHYFLSENYSKGSHYSRSAVKKAEKAASFNDAIAYAKKRVVCLERLPRTEDIERQLIDARTTLGLDYAQMLHLTEARESIVPIIDLALRHDYKRRLCQIYTLLGSYYYFVEDNYPEAFKALEQALIMAEEVTDIITSILASFWYACALGFNCEFEKSEKYFQRAIDINVAANNLVGVGIMKSNLAYFSYFCNGKIDLAFKTSKEGLRFAEDSGDIFSKVMAYASHGVSCYGKGLLEESNRYLLKTLEFSERINFAGWDSLAESFLSLSHYEMGDFEKSKEHYEKAALTLERNRLYPSWVGWMKIGTARSKVMNGEKNLDLESLYLYSRNNKTKAAEGWIQKHIGEILLNIDDHHISEAEHWILKAIEADQRNRMIFILGNDYALYADLLKRKGDRSKAQEHLGKAIEILKECGADGWVKKYEEQMAKLT
jgi:tetratricopeptide (TPR) repeat protein